ncbi:squalene/phytoene synthase family protein [Shimia sp. SDUM112013]|uniref:squalene/phytoene synthase family protein n=1 Tax=Shimia sp. SDUM112013 TaxID=3136160 RepID=UPI0032EB6764
MSDDIAACAANLAKGDPYRFAGVMAARPEARDVLFPLFAFNLEVARAPWVTEESMIAEMRLQWWRDALQEIAEGGEVRRHEVVTPLAGVLSPRATTLLDDLILARRWEIYREPFEDSAAFEDYIDKTCGNLLVVAAQSLGTAEESVVRDFAFANGIANWLRAIPELEARKRVPLVDGRPETVAKLARGALDRLKTARRNRRAVDRVAGQALYGGWQAEALLKQAASDPDRVKSGTLGTSDFARHLGLMRRAVTGRW